MAGIGLDSWHLNIAIFLFSSESCSACKTKFFDSQATSQTQKPLVIFANYVYMAIGNKNTKLSGQLQSC